MDTLETNYNANERIWSGANSSSIFDFNCSVGKIIYNNLRNFPNKVCQVSDIDGREVTNGELLTWSTRLALHFKKMGLGHDDVIGIVAKNSTYTTPVAVGCFMNCTPFHAVNGILDLETIQHVFENTAPKVIFCDGDVYEKIHAATLSLKPLFYTLTNRIDGVATVEDLLLPTANERTYRPESLVLGGEQTVAILCSSGTTGVPKCVCISNYSIQLENIFVTSDDIIFVNSGLDWWSGLVCTYLQTTTSCMRVITNKPYTPESLIELIKKYKITYIFAAPRYVSTLIVCPAATAGNLSSIRLITIIGGSVSLPTVKILQGILTTGTVNFGYGLSEVGLIAANIDNDKLTSVGKLFHCIKARIVDEEGVNLPPNEVGEILLHTGHTWNGYYGNPTETLKMQDSLGWFHSGDLGYFDDEGFLYIVDRKKDIIKYQGMHYWPAEIEQIIQELPEVAEVCVVGVYDERNGDAAGAVVVRRKGVVLTEQQVKDYVRKRLLVEYKQLHAGVIFVDQLPQNNNGKILKREAKILLEKMKL